ncbi:hypothetical protein J7E70_00490 [Variovorax paradoxus]|nr:hypothetical protein [Variovorax paradoxus]MBT2298929.1 hypothetical protein [Variovorax paradoxus]
MGTLNALMLPLTVLAAVGSAVIARLLFAFSTSAVQWPAYAGPWVRWNHLRTVMGVLAALSFTMATVQSARAGASGA